MKSHLLLVFLALIVVDNAQDQLLALHHHHFGDIQTCDIKYVKPGDDYDIRCESDHAILTRVSFYFIYVFILVFQSSSNGKLQAWGRGGGNSKKVKKSLSRFREF